MIREKKRILTTIVLAIVFILALTGCGNGNSVETPNQTNTSQTDTPNNEDDSLLIYTTVFPLYDFARQIGGEYVTVKSLIPWGAEAHDFEPSARDVANINEADLFIYNGAGFEVWIDKLTQNLDPAKTKVVEATKDIPMLGEGVDPTVWLDLTRAKQQAEKILIALVEIDPENEETYQVNYDQLIAELDTLDSAYEQAAADAERKEFIVAHAAFSYLADRYGLKQIPVAGFSPEDEPTQRELQKLIEFVKENKIKYVAFEELVESKVVETLRRETGTEAVTLSPLENITNEQYESGKTFIELMYENLETLKKVLEVK